MGEGLRRSGSAEEARHALRPTHRQEHPTPRSGLALGPGLASEGDGRRPLRALVPRHGPQDAAAAQGRQLGLKLIIRPQDGALSIALYMYSLPPPRLLYPYRYYRKSMEQ